MPRLSSLENITKFSRYFFTMYRKNKKIKKHMLKYDIKVNIYNFHKYAVFML